MCRSYLKLISLLMFISLIIALIDTHAKKTSLLTFHLTVKIDLVDVYYLKQVFHL